jgi:hypothetical protein
MVIRPWIMPYSAIYFVVWVSRALGAKLPYRPILAVLLVEESNELI